MKIQNFFTIMYTSTISYYIQVEWYFQISSFWYFNPTRKEILSLIQWWLSWGGASLWGCSGCWCRGWGFRQAAGGGRPGTGRWLSQVAHLGLVCLVGDSGGCPAACCFGLLLHGGVHFRGVWWIRHVTAHAGRTRTATACTRAWSTAGHAASRAGKVVAGEGWTPSAFRGHDVADLGVRADAGPCGLLPRSWVLGLLPDLWIQNKNGE